jgi:SAM-dependent methyltransferase
MGSLHQTMIAMQRRGRRTGWLLAGLLLVVLGCSPPSEPAPAPSVPRAAGEADVAYVPTPDTVVEKMLELAEIRAGDVVYDLGCGDGRILVAAAKKYGVKAVGVEIDPKVVQKAVDNVKQNHVEELVTIRQADIFTIDLSDATVVMLYLLPDLNVKLMPQLAKMKPGSRIVSHAFPMKGAKPERVVEFNGKQLLRWVVPWEKE